MGSRLRQMLRRLSQVVVVQEPVTRHEVQTEIETHERTEWHTEIELRDRTEWETVTEPVTVIKTRTVPRLVTQWVEEEYEDTEYETYERPITVTEEVKVDVPVTVSEDVEVDVVVPVTGIVLARCTPLARSVCIATYVAISPTEALPIASIHWQNGSRRHKKLPFMEVLCSKLQAPAVPTTGVRVASGRYLRANMRGPHCPDHLVMTAPQDVVSLVHDPGTALYVPGTVLQGGTFNLHNGTMLTLRQALSN